MKKLFLIFFLFLFSFNCFAINFATSSKTYPIWIFQQYNYCKEENIDPNNHNNIVLITWTTQTWPFGIEYNDLRFLVNRQILWEKINIISFSYQTGNREVFILKNKTIKNQGRMFNTIKMHWFPKKIKNEKSVVGKIVYRFDEGEIFTEYTEMIIW